MEKIKTTLGKTYVEYDSSKFDLSYIEKEKRIVLKRLADNVLLASFENVGFIIQSEIDEETNIVVSQWVSDKKSMLNHFVTNEYSKELRLKNEREIGYRDINKIRISDKAYITTLGNGYLQQIYNLKDFSMVYQNIYAATSLKDEFGDNMILVDQMSSASSDEIKEKFTYGINPETFEVVTSIWSNLQQRAVPIYSKEKTKEIIKEYAKKGVYLNENSSPLYCTLHFEFEKYTKLLTAHMKDDNKVYLQNGEVNEDFIKKLSNSNK